MVDSPIEGDGRYFEYRGSLKRLTEEGKRKMYEMSEKGIPLIMIGRELGVDRQAVYQHLRFSGGYFEWQEKNKDFLRQKKHEEESRNDEERLRKRELEHIAALINRVAESKVKEEERFAYEKAMDYESRTTGKKLPFYHSFLIYQVWNNSNNNGKSMSLEDIGNYLEHKEGKRYFPSAVKRVLERVGLTAFRTIDSMKRLTTYEKKRIERVVKIPLSLNDLSHFTFIPAPVLSLYLRDHPMRKGRDFSNVCLSREKKSYLNFSQASMVYEAKDSGLTDEETREYAGIRHASLDVAMVSREDCCERQLIGILKQIYPGMKIETPYVSKKDVEEHEHAMAELKK